MRINHVSKGLSDPTATANRAEIEAKKDQPYSNLFAHLRNKTPAGMRKTNAVILLLACFQATPAYAEWTTFFQDEEMEYFVDESTRLEKPRPRLRVLRKFHRPTAQGDQSAKLLYEADCPSRKLRMMSGTYNKGQMGDGEVSGMINSSGWLAADSRPVLQTLFSLLCRSHEMDQPVMGQRISPAEETD